jgi:hypothetical protein
LLIKDLEVNKWQDEMEPDLKEEDQEMVEVKVEEESVLQDKVNVLVEKEEIVKNEG